MNFKSFYTENRNWSYIVCDYQNKLQDMLLRIVFWKRMHSLFKNLKSFLHRMFKEKLYLISTRALPKKRIIFQSILYILIYVDRINVYICMIFKVTCFRSFEVKPLETLLVHFVWSFKGFGKFQYTYISKSNR